jgi:hypothetical protein
MTAAAIPAHWAMTRPAYVERILAQRAGATPRYAINRLLPRTGVNPLIQMGQPFYNTQVPLTEEQPGFAR